MSLSIQEKYSELKEELNGKNPFVRYALLKEELDNKDPLKRYIKVQEELQLIKKEQEEKNKNNLKNKEFNTLNSLENLFESLGGNIEEIETEIISEEEIEIVEKKDIQQKIEKIIPTEKPINGKSATAIDDIVGLIAEQEKNKENIEEETIDPIRTRIDNLENWIKKIAIAGPGSGEVRLLKLDDVDTTDLANNKTLKYNSSTGKFIFGTAGGQTIQNAGSDLTTRDNLNFDGTYLVAADDSSNDQTDITLNRSNITALANLTTVGFGVTSGSTSITTALTNIPLNTELLDTPGGYLSIIVSGTTYKVPYYT